MYLHIVKYAYLKKNPIGKVMVAWHIFIHYPKFQCNILFYLKIRRDIRFLPLKIKEIPKKEGGNEKVKYRKHPPHYLCF